MNRGYRVDALIEEIRQLSPGERRRLARQLRVNGLLESDEALTDLNALEIAPAITPPGLRHLLNPAPSQPAPAAQQDQTPLGAYKSPVSGRVVVGAPGETEHETASVMQPLPGQAPEQPIRVVFDGGSKGNPGQGYGSYSLDWPGFPRQVVRLKFGDRVTNNEAEYDTLIAALEAIGKRLKESGANPATALLDIRGDSLLVISQVKGEWKVNKAELETRRDKARSLLTAFGQVRLSHHNREKSVEVLGH
ncbi:MAG: ribonuclease HI family protein [Caldilineaceae bacterium]|nr:ribonuclease HI family protein [Caldilineaceae bacterium]